FMICGDSLTRFKTTYNRARCGEVGFEPNQPRVICPAISPILMRAIYSPKCRALEVIKTNIPNDKSLGT
ncbi:hypothetical protein KAU55_07855, partial [Candidatus Bathyarchaeota archaeon]|nr:hypothetical protein [Candidatus Bathyarchaeota archaeon]